MRSGCAGFSDTPALFVHQLTNELYRGGEVKHSQMASICERYLVFSQVSLFFFRCIKIGNIVGGNGRKEINGFPHFTCHPPSRSNKCQ